MKRQVAMGLMAACVANGVRLDDEEAGADEPAAPSANEIASELLGSSSSSVDSPTPMPTPMPTAFVHFASPAPTPFPTPAAHATHIPWNWPWESKNAAGEIEKIGKEATDKMNVLSQEQTAARARVLAQVEQSQKDTSKITAQTEVQVKDVKDQSAAQVKKTQDEMDEKVKAAQAVTTDRLQRVAKAQAASTAKISQDTKSLLQNQKNTYNEKVKIIQAETAKAVNQEKEAKDEFAKAQKSAEEKLREEKERNEKEVERIKNAGEEATKKASDVLAKATATVSQVRDKESKDIAEERVHLQTEKDKFHKTEKDQMGIEHGLQDDIRREKKVVSDAQIDNEDKQKSLEGDVKRTETEKDKVKQGTKDRLSDMKHSFDLAHSKEQRLRQYYERSALMEKAEAEEITASGKKLYNELVDKEKAKMDELLEGVSKQEKRIFDAQNEGSRVKVMNTREIKNSQDETERKIQKLTEEEEQMRKSDFEKLAAAQNEVKQIKASAAAKMKESRADMETSFREMKLSATAQEDSAIKHQEEALRGEQKAEEEARLHIRAKEQEIAQKIEREKEDAQLADKKLNLVTEYARENIDIAKKNGEKAIRDQQAEDQVKMRKAEAEAQEIRRRSEQMERIAAVQKEKMELEGPDALFKTMSAKVAREKERAEKNEEALDQAEKYTRQQEKAIADKSARKMMQVDTETRSEIAGLVQKSQHLKEQEQQLAAKTGAVTDSIALTIERIEDQQKEHMDKAKEAQRENMNKAKEEGRIQTEQELVKYKKEGQDRIQKARDELDEVQKKYETSDESKKTSLNKLEREIKNKIEVAKKQLTGTVSDTDKRTNRMIQKLRDEAAEKIRNEQDVSDEDISKMRERSADKVAKSNEQTNQDIEKIRADGLRKEQEMLLKSDEQRDMALKQVKASEDKQVREIQQRANMRTATANSAVQAEIRTANKAIAQYERVVADKNKQVYSLQQEETAQEKANYEAKHKLEVEVQQANAATYDRSRQIRQHATDFIEANNGKKLQLENEARTKQEQAIALDREMRRIQTQGAEAKHNAYIQVVKAKTLADGNVNERARDMTETNRVKTKDAKQMNDLLAEGAAYKRFAENEIANNLDDISIMRKKEEKFSEEAQVKLRRMSGAMQMADNRKEAVAQNRAETEIKDAKDYVEQTDEDAAALRARLGEEVVKKNLKGQLDLEKELASIRERQISAVETANRNANIEAREAGRVELEAQKVQMDSASGSSAEKAEFKDHAATYAAKVDEDLRIAQEASALKLEQEKKRLEDKTATQIDIMKDGATGFAPAVKDWASRHVAKVTDAAEEADAQKAAAAANVASETQKIENMATYMKGEIKGKSLTAAENFAAHNKAQADEQSWDTMDASDEVSLWKAKVARIEAEQAIEQHRATVQAGKAAAQAEKEEHENQMLEAKVATLETAAKRAQIARAAAIGVTLPPTTTTTTTFMPPADMCDASQCRTTDGATGGECCADPTGNMQKASCADGSKPFFTGTKCWRNYEVFKCCRGR